MNWPLAAVIITALILIGRQVNESLTRRWEQRSEITISSALSKQLDKEVDEAYVFRPHSCDHRNDG